MIPLAAKIRDHMVSYGRPIFDREPIFNQLIINECKIRDDRNLLSSKMCKYFVFTLTTSYNADKSGEGIKPHVDLVRFADGIAAISLGSSAVMAFRPATPKQQVTQNASNVAQVPVDGKAIRVLLLPGDCLCMEGEARWLWTHEIEASVEDHWHGHCVPRTRRVSITLRRLAS